MEIKTTRMSFLYPQCNCTRNLSGRTYQEPQEKLPFPCQSSRLLTIPNYNMVIKQAAFLLWLETIGIASTAQFNLSQEEFVKKQWQTFNVNLVFITWIHFPECWGPALVDPGNSKQGRHQRGSGNNCLIKL